MERLEIKVHSMLGSLKLFKTTENGYKNALAPLGNYTLTRIFFILKSEQGDKVL